MINFISSLDKKIFVIAGLLIICGYQYFRISILEADNSLLKIEKMDCEESIDVSNEEIEKLKANFNETSKNLLISTPKIIEKYVYKKDDSCEKKLNSLLESFGK